MALLRDLEDLLEANQGCLVVFAVMVYKGQQLVGLAFERGLTSLLRQVAEEQEGLNGPP